MIWVVLGASGFIGSRLADTLTGLGYTVRAVGAPRLSSTAADPGALADEARNHPALAALTAGCSGADVVVLAAGAATPDAAASDELTGANALLPAVVALAADRAGVRRVLQLSSAAVQGRTPILDETRTTAPFSPYSRSKALGEAVLLGLAPDLAAEVVIIRATSVQGGGRRTTVALRRIARSPLASVAGRGSDPSPVSSVAGLSRFVAAVGAHPGPVPPVVLQPWAGLSTAEVLRLAGGREPRQLPVRLCRAVIRLGYAVSARGRGRLDGSVRRVEAMWFGQQVDDGWARSVGLRGDPDVIVELTRTADR